MNQLHKWCQRDIYVLATLYAMGATDQEMAALFPNRTSQAIQKKITRFGLRPKNTPTHTVEPGRHLPESVAIATIQEALDAVLNQVLPSKNLAEAFMLLKNLYPFVHRIKASAMVKKHDTSALPTHEDGQWKSLTEIAQFLQAHHVPLRELHSSIGFPKDCTHLLEGIPQRPGDLLICANKIQRTRKQEPFYLTDVTEE